MHIAVDVGGTFTDLVVHGEDGQPRGYKSLTTPADLTDGVLNGLCLIADDHACGLSELLVRTKRFCFGTTTATNAVLEDKAARTVLITTRGFRETLLIREGGRADSYDMKAIFPKPYIPRSLTFEVTERIAYDGRVIEPLDEESVSEAIESSRQAGAEAIAVSLLWSIANAEHERRIGEMIEQALPDMPFSLSHKVNPCVREYRRTSATALDASLKPVVIESIRRLEGRLAAHGFTGTLSYVTSNGGQTSTREIMDKPVYLCFSGPSAAPEAGRRFSDIESIGGGNVITTDMGGTSFDVSIVTDGRIPMHREGTIAGHVFGVPSVEVHTIGAGGGSIARVDSGGFVHVGPESAGASPGPACYGKGGVRPTVTDANLVSGSLGESLGAGGGVTLSRDLARAAIRGHVGDPLGMSESEASALIRVGCEQNMVVAIEDLTVKRGVDPREYIMVAGGSAAGLHAVAIARELGIGTVLVPPMTGVLSAFGILTGNISFNFGESLFATSERFDFERVNVLLALLERDARAYLQRMNIDEQDQRLVHTCEARYAGQVWQLTLTLPERRIADAAALDSLVEAFHSLHETRYAVRSETDPVEITEWNVQAIGQLQDVDFPELTPDGRIATPIATRRSFLRELDTHVDVPVLQGERLPLEQEFEGPVFIEDPLSTIVVNPGARVRLSRFGSYIIDLDR